MRFFYRAFREYKEGMNSILDIYNIIKGSPSPKEIDLFKSKNSNKEALHIFTDFENDAMKSYLEGQEFEVTEH